MNVMLKVKIFSFEEVSTEKPGQRKRNIKAAEANQRTKVIMTNIPVTKKTDGFADEGTKAIFLVHLFLHSNKRRIFFVATVTAGVGIRVVECNVDAAGCSVSFLRR